MDLDQLRKDKEELLAQLDKLQRAERDAGFKSVKTSDVSQSDWKGVIRASIHRQDPEAAGDPKLAMWFDTDRFGTPRPQRALMIRRFVNGDFATGKGRLPHGALQHQDTVDKAVKEALDELQTVSLSSYRRGDALSQAQRDAAEERIERKKLEARLAQLEQLIAKGAPEPAPAPAPAAKPAPAPEPATEQTKAEQAAEPSPFAALSSAGPSAPDEPGPAPAPKADAFKPRKRSPRRKSSK